MTAEVGYDHMKNAAVSGMPMAFLVAIGKVTGAMGENSPWIR